MKAIKKVQVTPLDYNFGKIIDSASTTDDKTKNTYSMRVIENLINDKFVKITQTASIYEDNGGMFTRGAVAIINLPQGFTRDNSYVISARVIPPYGSYEALPLTLYDADRKVSGVMRYEYSSNTEISTYYVGNSYNIDDELTFEIILVKIS